MVRKTFHGGATDHREVYRGGAGARGGAQSEGADAAQIGDGFERASGKAGRLPGTRSIAMRIVCSRGRIGGRIGKNGAGPEVSGDLAAQGKNSQRREGALRQDAGA